MRLFGKRLTCPWNHEIDEYVCDLNAIEFGTILKRRRRFTFKDYYNFTIDTYKISFPSGIRWVDSNTLCKADYTDDDFDDEIPEGNSCLGGILGIFAHHKNHRWGDLNSKMYVALDDIDNPPNDLKLRIFPSFRDSVNRDNAAALSIFEPVYRPEPRAERKLSNDEIDQLMNILNEKVKERYLGTDIENMMQKSLGKKWECTVWQEMIYTYNYNLTCDTEREDFLDIKMPIPDYTQLKS